jgi:DNA-binding NarL/FixJ family response regulator
MKSPAPKRARILIADDHQFFRDGLADFINRQKSLICCASVADSAGIRSALENDRPDILLLDLRLGAEDGLELIKALRHERPALPILVLSQYSEDIYGERALRAGAQGYLMKEEAANEVLTAIQTVLGGQMYASQRFAMLSLQKSIAHRKSPTCGSGIDSLSDRELQVFQLLGNGRSTRQIAEDLKLSVKTVETYRENIKHKLGFPDAAALRQGATEWAQRENSPSSHP